MPSMNHTNHKGSIKLKTRQIRKKLCIPIYDAEVWIIVKDNILKARKKLEHVFGPTSGDPDWDGVCCHGGGCSFGLFFEREALTLKIVAHEVFHLTHRIMDWTGANFDASHHEQGALLHSYLMDEILTTLCRLNEKLKL